MLNHFSNLSCYEEFEIQCALTGISKVDVLKERILDINPVCQVFTHNTFFFFFNSSNFDFYQYDYVLWVHMESIIFLWKR